MMNELEVNDNVWIIRMKGLICLLMENEVGRGRVREREDLMNRGRMRIILEIKVVVMMKILIVMIGWVVYIFVMVFVIFVRIVDFIVVVFKVNCV